MKKIYYKNKFEPIINYTRVFARARIGHHTTWDIYSHKDCISRFAYFLAWEILTFALCANKNCNNFFFQIYSLDENKLKLINRNVKCKNCTFVYSLSKLSIIAKESYEFFLLMDLSQESLTLPTVKSDFHRFTTNRFSANLKKKKFFLCFKHFVFFFIVLRTGFRVYSLTFALFPDYENPFRNFELSSYLRAFRIQTKWTNYNY